jgi:nicotinamide mononucleotide transporter
MLIKCFNDIILEFIAFFFGILSVWFAKARKYLVYPTGLIALLLQCYFYYM